MCLWFSLVSSVLVLLKSAAEAFVMFSGACLKRRTLYALHLITRGVNVDAKTASAFAWTFFNIIEWKLHKHQQARKQSRVGISLSLTTK